MLDDAEKHKRMSFHSKILSRLRASWETITLEHMGTLTVDNITHNEPFMRIDSEWFKQKQKSHRHTN